MFLKHKNEKTGMGGKKARETWKKGPTAALKGWEGRTGARDGGSMVQRGLQAERHVNGEWRGFADTFACTAFSAH